MRIFWLFRSNIKHLEYYHKYDNLEEFEMNCHDFYMLFPIWLLRENHFDAVVIWRLSTKPPKEITFNVDGKTYTQRWVRNFSLATDPSSHKASPRQAPHRHTRTK